MQESIIKWTVWFAVMTLVMGFIGKSRMRQRSGHAANEMRAPVSILVVGVFCTALFIAAAVLSQIFPGVDSRGVKLEHAEPLYAVLFLGFALMGVPMIMSYFMERHRVEEDRLHYRTLAKRGELRWEDVESVRYSPTMKWFALKAKDGRTVRVSILLTGLTAFARTLLLKVPEERIHPETNTTLVLAARQQLPSVWL